jgi:exodeoxyribonuclease-5
VLFRSVALDDHGNELLLWEAKDNPPEAGLIIADECSMIDHRLGRDLLALGIPLLVTGDPFQLPPISGKPFFNGAPDFMLTEIHRQAHGSQPLELAVAVHNDEPVRPKFDDLLLAADVVIVALHETRRRINPDVAARLMHRPLRHRRPGLMLPHELRARVLNGELWVVADARQQQATRTGSSMTSAPRPRSSSRNCFLLGPPKLQSQDGLGLHFGYAISHKAQGRSGRVVIAETTSPGFRRMAGSSGLHPNEFTARWLYTAISRAAVQADVMEAPR